MVTPSVQLEKKRPNTEMHFTHVPRVKYILKPMARDRYCSKFGNIWWQSEVSFPFLTHTQNNTPHCSWEKFLHIYGFHFPHLIFHLRKTGLWKPLMYTDLLVSRLIPGSHRYCCNITSQHINVVWLPHVIVSCTVCDRYNIQKYCIQCSKHTSITCKCKYKIYNHNIYNTLCCFISLLYNYMIVILLPYHRRHQATN